MKIIITLIQDERYVANKKTNIDCYSYAYTGVRINKGSVSANALGWAVISIVPGVGS